MINAKQLIDISIESMPDSVHVEIVQLESKLIETAKQGKRKYIHYPNDSQYAETIQTILQNEGFRANICVGTSSGTRIEIYW